MTATDIAIDEPVTDDREWSLVAITNGGKVSILKNLDTYTARETYKRLKPHEYPKTYIWPACGEFSYWQPYSVRGESIDRVEIIGAAGEELDPWAGVEPRIIDMAMRHEREIRVGDVQCDICGDPVKREAAREERHRKELLEAVPLAFWLEDSNAC